MSLQSFLNEFQEAQKALSDASAAAAETARQKALDAYDTATRLNLNIRIKAPVIVIPTCSHSSDALCLDLGLLEITNNTAEITVPNEERLAVIDEIKLQICDVKISKVIILDGHETTVDGEYHKVLIFPIIKWFFPHRRRCSVWFLVKVQYDEPDELHCPGHSQFILHLVQRSSRG